jgi:hypothetical protein
MISPLFGLVKLFYVTLTRRDKYPLISDRCNGSNCHTRSSILIPQLLVRCFMCWRHETKLNSSQQNFSTPPSTPKNDHSNSPNLEMARISRIFRASTFHNVRLCDIVVFSMVKLTRVNFYVSKSIVESTSSSTEILQNTKGS